MFRQVCQAVTPLLSLRETLDRWAEISADLAEPLRKRATQEQILLEEEEEQL